MRWRGRSSSSNVDDRRHNSAPSGGFRGGNFARGGGGSLMRFIPMLYRMFGMKGVVIGGIGIAAYAFFSGNLGMLTGVGSSMERSPTGPLTETAAEKEMVEFVGVVLKDTEHTWNSLFKAQGMDYAIPTLVLFRDAVSSACGTGQAAMGPFYCPADQQIYIDLSFFSELATRFDAPGDFAQAYVIAHEVGHHIQTITGISHKVMQLRRSASKIESNKLSVLQELQADCFAGVWGYQANHQRQLLEPGDSEEGLKAASAIGDDTLQRQAQGRVTPDSFTHGSAAQRVQWFKTGLESGQMQSCNTFEQAGIAL